MKNMSTDFTFEQLMSGEGLPEESVRRAVTAPNPNHSPSEVAPELCARQSVEAGEEFYREHGRFPTNMASGEKRNTYVVVVW